MMARNRSAALLLAVLAACQGAAPTASDLGVRQPVGSVAGDRTTEAAPRAAPRKVEPAVPQLAGRIRALADRGQILPAISLGARELAERCAAGSWDDPALLADSVVAAVALEDLLQRANAWTTLNATLLEPIAAGTPPELRSQLELISARALVRAGKLDEARALTRSHGTVVDWRAIGPFANERGGGFDAAYPPEASIDLEASVRGKERDVAWRSNPCPEQALGVVMLDEMLRPNEQVVAYLATAVKVDVPRAVCLWIGSTGELKAWHGKRLALARKVQRSYHRDQDRVVLDLAPGWNPLLLKVGHEEGGMWGVSARLTELDGSPLRDLAFDSSKAGTPLEARESAAIPARTARELLEARGDDAEALRLLAEWHRIVHPDDAKAHTPKTLAERALALAPDDVDTLYLVARANEPGPRENAAEIRHNERLMPLKRVLELEPAHLGALLDLGEFWMSLNPRVRAAQELALQAVEIAPDSPRALTLLARTLEAYARDAEARLLRERAWSTPEGRLRPDMIAATAQTLHRTGQVEPALALVEGAISSGRGERRLCDLAIGMRIGRGELEAAQELSEAWLSRSPFDVDRRLATAEALEFSGRLQAARAQVERALAVCPEEPRAFRVLARLADRAGDAGAADRARAELLRLDPGYDLARRQRALLAENAAQPERFEEPWRWDALSRLGTVEPSRTNDAVQVVDRSTVWRVETDGTEHRYEHVVLQVENTAGVKALDSYWIPYPSDGSLQVYNVRVIHADGTFDRAPAPRGGDRSFGGQYVRGFDLPPLVPGDLVDVEYRVDQSQPDVFGQYFGLRHSFQVDFPDALAPVRRAELVVLAPADVRLHTVEHNGASLRKSVEQRDGLVVRSWVATDLRRPASENAMPDRSEFVPLVDISTFESWEAFASWWWGFIEKEFVTTQAMKDKVAELTAGLATEADKVRAIARFVGQDIRYNAWSFGTHGYQPFSAATIFERRFGDCKDKSILLRQMLAEIGVEAHPVLINAQYRRPDEKLDVAMVGHFNHCIAYLPATAERAGYYLDATADRNPVEYLRADDQGAKVLHVRDGHGEIVQIPYTPAPDNAWVRRYDVELDREGAGNVRLVDESDGMFGVQNRYQFGGEQGDLRQRLAQALAEAFGKVDVLDVSTSKLEDIGAPARLEARLRVENLWTRESSGAALRPGFDDIPILGVAAEREEDREWDIVLDRPFQMRSTVLYRLPAGSRVKDLPADATVSVTGLVDYSMRVRTTPEGIEIERIFTLHERRIPRSRYGDFRAAIDEIRAAEARTVMLQDLQPGEPTDKENK